MENADALKIWSLVQDQVIVGGMGVVLGINHIAVWKAIEKYRIRDELDVFEKVIRAFSHVRELERLKEETRGRGK